VTQPASWTSLELVRWTTGFFTRHGLASPRLDAELLLAHVLGVGRLDLYLRFEEPIPEPARASFRDLVRRRAQDRVPVAYLTGKREFWSLSFEVTPATLIPRPETEVLVRAVVDLSPSRVADLGTGCGAIAAAVATALPNCEVVALDVSGDALDVARGNLLRLGLLERVTLVSGDGPGALPGEFDVIVSNPPYVPSDEIAGLAPELRHEPRVALDGGADGLAVVSSFLREAPGRLRPGGAIALEIGLGQAAAVEGLLRAAGARTSEVRKDLAGVERVVVGRFAA
jgi:release factor glutamine methyltransferase